MVLRIPWLFIFGTVQSSKASDPYAPVSSRSSQIRKDSLLLSFRKYHMSHRHVAISAFPSRHRLPRSISHVNFEYMVPVMDSIIFAPPEISKVVQATQEFAVLVSHCPHRCLLIVTNQVYSVVLITTIGYWTPSCPRPNIREYGV
jgi:hypothetical protein